MKFARFVFEFWAMDTIRFISAALNPDFDPDELTVEIMAELCQDEFGEQII